jgi:hypothetical protein
MYSEQRWMYTSGDFVPASEIAASRGSLTNKESRERSCSGVSGWLFRNVEDARSLGIIRHKNATSLFHLTSTLQ